MELLPHIQLETGKNPNHAIIWLHGLGADGEDFVPVAGEMNLPVPVRYIFPHAPKRPVTLNGGFVMRAWYDVYAAAPNGGLDLEGGRPQDEAGIRASQAEIEKLIAREQQRGIAAGNIYLAGFSQGGAVVLHTGLRHAAQLGGIIALSTYLPLAATLAQEASSAAKSTPIFMAHGRGDPVIPYTLGRASAQQLDAAAYPLEWHEYPMPHSVCAEEIEDIERWLEQRLAGG
ncbi:MAG TPA: carboxylesterase [Gallionellaceae bacterium]|nr:carboxylesterase [Gallionellaceae bacterium]